MNASHMRERLPVAMFPTLVIAAVLLAACGGDDSDDSAEQVDAQPLATVTHESAVETVETFDPADENAVASLNEIVADGGDYVPSLEPLLDDDDPNVRWAAVYTISGLTDTGDEIAVLGQVLLDEDIHLSATAAGSLAGLGVADSIPILIEALSSDAALPFSDPSIPLSTHARATLEEYTGESFDDAAGWQDWWDENGSDLTWEDGQYVAD